MTTIGPNSTASSQIGWGSRFAAEGRESIVVRLLCAISVRDVSLVSLNGETILPENFLKCCLVGEFLVREFETNPFSTSVTAISTRLLCISDSFSPNSFNPVL